MSVIVDSQQVTRFAALMRTLTSVQAFDFCGGQEGVLFPVRNSLGALEAFFFNAAHQFGFWYENGGRYERPMIAMVGGVKRKGSDFLFYSTQRALNSDPDFFTPENLAKLSDAECNTVFRDDGGCNPLPMWSEHLSIMKSYASWFVHEKISPASLVARANESEKPLAAFLKVLQSIPGYREDPMQKKAMLLAVILENRPEHFLRVTDPESAVPIIDYHLQRSALRTGLVKVVDPVLRNKIENREIVSAPEELAIRQATYEAIKKLVASSGLSVAAVDYFFFTNRSRCPEMTEPLCRECPVNSICSHETTLFQPVFRTTYY